jgi:hypothetical protein
MTDHKATPEQWADIEKWNSTLGGFYSCVLELRARVELLELGAGIRDAVAKELDRNYPAKPDGSLVERVADAINPSICADTNLYLPEARAAILEVAAWVEETQNDHWSAVSRMLRFELEQETSND